MSQIFGSVTVNGHYSIISQYRHMKTNCSVISDQIYYNSKPVSMNNTSEKCDKHIFVPYYLFDLDIDVLALWSFHLDPPLDNQLANGMVA